MDINKETYQDIEKAKKIINLRFYQTIDEFSKYCSLYAFTNENVNAAYNYLDVQNKKILTIAASGDHVFEAISKGAKEVTYFDVNSLAKYYIELKGAGIKVLPQVIFYDYFFKEPVFSHDYNSFNFFTYKTIRNHLGENTRLFWDSLYQEYSGEVIRKSKLFYSSEESFDFLKSGLSYLKPQNYQKLKKILQNSNIFAQNNFLNADIRAIPKVMTNKFDIIYLSNIADYIPEIFPKPYIINFKSFIETELDPLLNEQGKIVAAYIFHADYKNFKNATLINKAANRKKFLQENYEFQSIDNSNLQGYTNDKILIYKKTR